MSGSVSAPVVTGSYSPGGGSSGANNGSNGAGAQSVSTGSTAPLSFNNGALPRVTLPIGSFAPIDLKDLPTFGGTGKNAFSFVPKIDNFVFSGLPADVVDRLAAYPSADIYLKSLGLKTAQDLINIRLRPLNLKGEMPEGLFMLRVNGKAVNTSLTGDKSAKAFQLAQATLGDEVTVRLNVSEDVKGAISGKFNGQTVTFSRQGSVAEARLVLPEKAGRYMLTSNRAAFGLAIDFANAPTKAVTSPDAKPKGGIIRWLSSLGSGILSLIRK